MNVALIGATGDVGARLLAELLRRGHSVTAIARSVEKLAPQPGVAVRAADASDVAGLSAAVRGHDAAVISVLYKHVDTDSLIKVVREAGVKRWIAVGGAGSLRDAQGALVMSSPKFPPHVLPEATANADFFNKLQGVEDVDWTYISPSLFFQPGTRTGTYRIGKDDLIMNGPRPASMSFEDYAVALVDELEAPKHSRARFTVADPA